MKLFVWENFSPDYTEGLAVAIAKDETDSRKQIIAKHGYNPIDWGDLSVYRCDRRMAAAVSGGG